MRTLLLTALIPLVGCAATTRTVAPYGATRFEYRGGLEVVFTNATPAAMCGLYLSDDRDLDYGDNWLAERVPSGHSIALRVRPGTYKARWETCPAKGSVPGYSATLWRETAFDLTRDTQLYAYVAEATPPTARAALDPERERVMFQGLPFAPAGSPTDAQLAHRTPPDDPALTPRTSLAEYIERPKKR